MNSEISLKIFSFCCIFYAQTKTWALKISDWCSDLKLVITQMRVCCRSLWAGFICRTDGSSGQISFLSYLQCFCLRLPSECDVEPAVCVCVWYTNTALCSDQCSDTQQYNCRSWKKVSLVTRFDPGGFPAMHGWSRLYRSDNVHIHTQLRQQMR